MIYDDDAPVKNYEYFQITCDDNKQGNEEDLAVEEGVVSQVPLGGRQAVQLVLRRVADLCKYVQGVPKKGNYYALICRSVK